MNSISKKSIAGILVIIALVAGSWLWYEASKKERQSQMEPQQAREYNNQPVEGNIDISNWKTYRRDEYGIEFRYPSDSVVVVQPSASRMFGSVFILTQNMYDDLQKNSPVFQTNPVLGLIDKGNGIQITWNRSSLITGYFQSNGLEKSFKFLLNDGKSTRYPNGMPNQSSLFETTVVLSEITDEMYAYELQLKDVDMGTSSARRGLIWEELKSFYVSLEFMNTSAPSVDLKNNAIQTAQSFEMF